MNAVISHWVEAPGKRPVPAYSERDARDKTYIFNRVWTRHATVLHRLEETEPVPLPWSWRKA